MEREAIRVEPFSTYLERRRKGPIFPVVAAGGFVFVSGLPPFDPATGEAQRRPFREQAQIVLEQMKRCLEAAGSSLERVVKCNVYCTDAARFDEFDEVYARYFPAGSPARIFLVVPAFPGAFDKITSALSRRRVFLSITPRIPRAAGAARRSYTVRFSSGRTGPEGSAGSSPRRK